MTKKTGIRKIPIDVAASIPETTAVPMLLRAAELAPLAMVNGKQPIMKASEVMMIGRSLKPDASTAAFFASIPLSVRTLANSTIKIAFFAAIACPEL